MPTGVRLAALVLVTLAAPAPAQTPADEHAKHHPAAGTPPAAPAGMAGSQPAGTSGAGSGMGSGMGSAMDAAAMEVMMRQMGRPVPTELFPTLMNVPALSPDQRADVARRARAQVEAGRAQLRAATARLADAAAREDDAAAQEATRQVREATGVLESGVAAQRALAEGRTSRDVALGWFQREMSVAYPVPAERRRTVFGLVPFHLVTMALLVAFALATLSLYYVKMRRAAALFGRLDPGTDPPPGAAPAPTGTSGPPTPAPPTPGPPTPAPPTPAPPTPAPPTPAPPVPPAPPSAGTSGGALPPAVPTAPAGPPAGAASAPTAASAVPVTANWQGRLRVASIVAETPAVKTLRLVPASGEPVLPFTFVPGQFLNVSFWIGGARMRRSYSISSSPTQRGYVELTVRREPRGAVSRHIVDLLEVGDQVEAGGPVGRFTFTGAEADSIVLIAGGVGVTPMMSIARWLTEQSWPGDVYFVYACRTPADIIFVDELAGLARRNPKLHLAITVSGPDAAGWTGARGRLSKELLARTVPDLASRRIHLCGPPGMMVATQTILREMGVPPDQVKTELFGTPKPAPAPAGTSAAARAPATGPLVTFSKHEKTARIHADQTVLELSEALDIGIDYACRVGTCGVCKVQKTTGEIEMAVQDALEPDDHARGVILACQAKPVTDTAVAA